MNHELILERIDYRSLLPVFRGAYRNFRLLVAELLRRGLAKRATLGDLHRDLLSQELQQCTQTWVIEQEFNSCISLVIHLGTVARTEPYKVWPYGTTNPSLLDDLIVEANAAARSMLEWFTIDRRDEILRVAALGLPTRFACTRVQSGRGPRASMLLDGISRCIVRERLFRNGRTAAEAVRMALNAWPAELEAQTQTSLETHVKRLRQREAPIPHGWHSTILGSVFEVLKQRDPIGAASPASSLGTHNTMRVAP